MRSQLEGSQALAQAVARCRPQVVPAYPITPQTHIVEAVGRMVRDGSLDGCAFLTVESEFAAMSAAIGASATGARAYTATSSQGLLYMTEALFNAGGLGLPIVMTVANRAIGAPINIWNDHSDSMSQRDCGWVQLYAADNQAAIDLHVIAFRLAEQLSVPVMVCVDGFVLTHAFEPLDVPEQELVDRFLPPYRPRQQLDPDDPVTIGAMVGPEAFTEVRWLADAAVGSARERFAELAGQWERAGGRRVGAVERYGPRDASVVVVALGSVRGTIEVALDERAGGDVALLGLTMFRPFPYAEVAAALDGAREVVVIERTVAPGAGGPVTADVRTALAGRPTRVVSVTAGLGGRPVTRASIGRVLDDAVSARLPDSSWLDLRTDLVEAAEAVPWPR